MLRERRLVTGVQERENGKVCARTRVPPRPPPHPRRQPLAFTAPPRPSFGARGGSFTDVLLRVVAVFSLATTQEEAWQAHVPGEGNTARFRIKAWTVYKPKSKLVDSLY